MSVVQKKREEGEGREQNGLVKDGGRDGRKK